MRFCLGRGSAWVGESVQLGGVGRRKEVQPVLSGSEFALNTYLQDGMRGTRFVRLAEAALATILQMAVPGLCSVWLGLPRLQFSDWPGLAEFLNLTAQRPVFAGV